MSKNKCAKCPHKRRHLPTLEPMEEQAVRDLHKTGAALASITLLIFHVSVFEVGCATWETVVHLIKVVVGLK